MPTTATAQKRPLTLRHAAILLAIQTRMGLRGKQLDAEAVACVDAASAEEKQTAGDELRKEGLAVFARLNVSRQGGSLHLGDLYLAEALEAAEHYLTGGRGSTG